MKHHIPLRVIPAVILVLLLTTCSKCALGGGDGTETWTETSTAALVPAVNTDGAPTVYVPGGTYQIGSTATDLDALAHEMPQHPVTLTGFNIYTHEVTNAMYQACVDAGSCLAVSSIRGDLADYTAGAYGEYPVVGVDWHMAQAYCTWANGRLPTEAEWEVAARGDDLRIFPWGDTEASCLNAGIRDCSKGDLPLAVGSFADGNSPFGAWDMAGNVWEWVNDWYDANYYAASPEADPSGPWGGDAKIVRGGGWNSTSGAARTANRMGIDPSLGYKDLGFRCVANAFPAAPAISIPEVRHAVHAGDGRSVDSGGRPETPTIGLRAMYWGIPAPDCRAGGEVTFGIDAMNSFGATYSADVDGVPLTCSYDPAILYLHCRGVPGSARTIVGGAEFYRFNVHMTAPDGTPLPADRYGFFLHTPAASLATCASGTDPGGRLIHSASAFCGSDGRYAAVMTSVPFEFRDLSISGTALSILPPAIGTRVIARVPDSIPAGDTSLVITAFTLDGLTRLEWSEPLTIPDCSRTPGAGAPTFHVSASCGTAGRYLLDITYTPTVMNVSDVNLQPRSTTCTRVSPGHLQCDAGPEDVMTAGTGTPHFFAMATLTPPYVLSSGSLLVWMGAIVDAPTCTGSIPSGGDFIYQSPACRPDGLPGAVARVRYVGTAATVAMTTKFGGSEHACTPTGADLHSFTCDLPVPLPTDLQFCTSLDGAGYNCVASPYTSAHLPARCGGTTETDRWITSVSCLSDASDEDLVVNVGVVGGRTPILMKAGVGRTDWYGTPNPGMPGFFRMDVQRSLLAGDVLFTADFPEGAQLFQTLNLAELAPAMCKPDGPTPPGGSSGGAGGLCVDNPAASGWQNPSNRYDVNNDGCVTPLDVLLLINYLNLHPGESALAVPRPAGSAFLDVSGDGAITPVDVLFVIQYINDHAGSSCTPACSGPGYPPAPSGGEWWWEVICNPAHVRPGWIELRAHYPADPASVIAFGEGRLCSMGSTTPGTISQFCPPDIDFSLPMRFWTQTRDGTLSEHTFTNAAELVATCPRVTPGPDFRAVSSCSPVIAGAYDITFTWTPTTYEIYAIYDQAGRVITSCGMCTGGTCTCTGLLPEADGLIHVGMDNRTGAAEVTTPLSIAPPTCGAAGTGGWGLRAACSTTSPGYIDLYLTSPSAETSPIVDTRVPGWSCIMPDLSGADNTIHCTFPTSLRGSGPLTWNFFGPAPDYTPIFHTFTEYESVVPTTCSGGTSGDGWSLSAVCSTRSGYIDMSITAPASIPFTCSILPMHTGWEVCVDLGSGHNVRVSLPVSERGSGPFTIRYGDAQTHTFPEYDTLVPVSCSDSSTASGGLYWDQWCQHGHASFEIRSFTNNLTITSFTVNGVAPAASDCTGMGTTNATCNVPDSWQNVRSIIRAEGINSAGATHSIEDRQVFTCGTPSSDGWSISNARCSPTGGAVQFNINYPSSMPPFTSVTVTDGRINFRCDDYRSSIPYHLGCGGAVTNSPGVLSVAYTAGEGTFTQLLSEWPTLAPRSCATPEPPTDTPGPPARRCSDFTTEAACYSDMSMSCKWDDVLDVCFRP